MYIGKTVRPDHAVPAMEGLSPHRRTAWWRLSSQDADMCRALPYSGLRSTHLSREPARRRSLPVGASREALTHGHPRSGVPLYAGRCQRVAPLAHLRRVRPSIDRSGKTALRQRRLWAGSDQHGLCVGFDHHRPVSTDSVNHAVRENAHTASLTEHRRSTRKCQLQQPTESIRFLTGH